MPALSNPKHEAFCQAYVRGEHCGNARACYKAVYGKDNRAGASRLQHRTDFLQRIGELRDQAIEIERKATDSAVAKLGITKERVLAELAKLGFANMLDYVRPTVDGDVEIDLSRLDRDKATAITEVVVDTYQDGRGDEAKTVKRVRFKLADKRSALFDLSKMAGFHIPDPVAEINVSVSAKAELVDRPPRETFKQWEERRRHELGGKPKEGKLK